MSFDLIIKNGTVILENEARVVDIAVKGGKIAAIGQDLGDAKEVMDRRAWLMRTPIFLNRVVATGKVMKPVLAQRQKVVSPP